MVSRFKFTLMGLDDKLADNMVKIKDGEGKGLMKPLANVTR
jgi:hypothetical protein